MYDVTLLCFSARHPGEKEATEAADGQNKAADSVTGRRRSGKQSQQAQRAEQVGAAYAELMQLTREMEHVRIQFRVIERVADALPVFA